MRSKLVTFHLVYILAAGCSSHDESPTLSEQIVAAQVLDNERRCSVSEIVLMRCEFESWGKEKVIINIDGKKATYHNVSSKELGAHFELDARFPSMEYKIWREKDMLYTQLEQSGYCAFNEIEKDKKEEKKNKKRSFKPRTIFLPATITTGLMDDGVVFVRKWSQKKSANKKQLADENSRPVGFSPNQQELQNSGASEHEELTMKCAVASRGRDDLGPGPTDKDGTTELPKKSPPATESPDAEKAKLD